MSDVRTRQEYRIVLGILATEVGNLIAFGIKDVLTGKITQDGSVGGSHRIWSRCRTVGCFVETLLVGIAAGEYIADVLQPTLVDAPGTVGIQTEAYILSFRGGLSTLIVRILFAGIFPVNEVETGVASQLMVEEGIGIHHLTGSTLVVLIGSFRVAGVVSIVGTYVQGTLVLAQFIAGTHGYLIHIRIGFSFYTKRFPACFGVYNHRTRSQVAIFYRRNPTDDFHRLNVFGRDATHIDTTARRCTTTQCRSTSRYGWVHGGEVGVV